MTYVWLGVGVIGLTLFVAGLVTYTGPIFRRRSASGSAEMELGEVPMTPLQKRAWWGLGVGVVWCAAMLAVVLGSDPVSMIEDRGERLLFTGILMAGVLAYVVVLILMKRLTAGGETMLDERDRSIMARAGTVQSALMLATLAGWAIVLSETYWDERAIPIVFSYLIFWSVFIVYLLAYSLGILLGYAGWGNHGEG